MSTRLLTFSERMVCCRVLNLLMLELTLLILLYGLVSTGYGRVHANFSIDAGVKMWCSSFSKPWILAQWWLCSGQ